MSLEQVLGRPDGIEIAIASRRLRHGPPGHGDDGPSEAAVVLLPGLFPEELLPDRTGGGPESDRSSVLAPDSSCE